MKTNPEIKRLKSSKPISVRRIFMLLILIIAPPFLGIAGIIFANDILMPLRYPNNTAGKADLSNISLFGVKPLLPIAKALCDIRGGAYELTETNNWTCNNLPSNPYMHGSCGKYDCVGKPVIYLYPTEMQSVRVRLDFRGTLTATYPQYDQTINGWDVTAYPDGKLIDREQNEYSYLFWEGTASGVHYDMTSGFIVRGVDTATFLKHTLEEAGLTPKEYNEFIVYWYPKMKENPYNLIHFAGKEYTDAAKLTITPQPDAILRIFMVYKSLDSEITVKPQNIPHFRRHGFTAVEWGGTEIN